MEHWTLSEWCHRAVSTIAYPPDRRAVFNELRQHLDDRCEDFLAKGLSPNEAAKKTVEVMGNPFELAAQLRAIHRPFWGYAYSIVKWFCILAVAVLLIVALFSEAAPLDGWFTSHDDLRPAYLEPEYSEPIRTFYAEPGQSFTDGGYTVTLSRIAVVRHDNGADELHFSITTVNHLPWAERPVILWRMTVRDSLGNVYIFPDAADDIPNCRQHVAYTTHRERYPLWESDGELRGFAAEDVEWVEFCFDQDNRNYRFRVNLTGGGGA